MAYNSILTAYTAHLASPVEPEIPAICTGIADMLYTVLGELPLSKPLAGKSGAAVSTPAALPWLVVLPDPAGGNVEQALSNALQQGHAHRLDAIYLFGPDSMPADQLLTARLDYLFPSLKAVSENQHLDIGVRGIRAQGWDWGVVSYAGKAWAGLRVKLEVLTIYAMRWPI
jgi:hypothetical protein